MSIIPKIFTVVPESPQTFIYPQELSRKAEQVTPNPSAESVEEGGGVTTPPAIVPGCPQWPPLKITMRYVICCEVSHNPY